MRSPHAPTARATDGDRALRLSPAVFIAALLAFATGAWALAVWSVRGSYIGMVPATGVMATLADAIARGQAPGHSDGTTFLVTFYLPPFPMLVALARAIGFGWPGALRASSVLAGLLLLLSSAWAARALGGGRRGSALAPALVMATYTFHASSLGGRADLLAAALSIAALAAWCEDADARGWRLPALAAFSFLVKATSVAIPVALVALALGQRRWGSATRFALRFAACALAGVALTLPVHGPQWYASALSSLITATPSTSSWLRGPTELVRYLGACGELAVFAALALTQLASRWPQRRAAVAYLAAALAIALYVMTNFGAGPNHLDELAAAVAILAAVWAAPRLSRPSRLAAALLAVAVAGACWRNLQSPLRSARSPENLRTDVIAAVRAESGPVLTEDALISLAAGRRPFVSDPGALRSLSLQSDPRALQIERSLERAEYLLVVLDNDLETDARWYHNVHLGDRVTELIRRRDLFSGNADGHFLWRPRADSTASGSRSPEPR